MRAWIRTVLRWLDARLLGDGDTFPIYRSTDGSVTLATGAQPKTMEILFSNVIETGPPAEVIEEQRFRVAVFNGATDEGEKPHYWLDLQFRDLKDDTWRPLLMLHESNFPVIRSVVDKVAKVLESERKR